MSSHDEVANAGSNESNNTHFSDILNANLSRRRALMGSMAATGALFFGTGSLAGCSDDDKDNNVSSGASGSVVAPAALGFTAIDHSVEDVVKLPTGYSFSVLLALGDPIKEGIADWADNGTETGDSYMHRAGDHHDAMNYFGLGANGKWAPNESTRGLLCINHEAITQNYLHAEAASLAEPRDEDQVVKEMNVHGVAVIEIKKNAAGKFVLDKASSFNRRITQDTPVELAGPLRGSKFAVTAYDVTGRTCRGTLNNCGSGITPWGTYLTGEENWFAYFRRAAGDNSHLLRTQAEVNLLNRYGMTQGSVLFNDKGWMTVTAADQSKQNRFSRWNAGIAGSSSTGSDDFRNEPNTFGYMVEVDPFNPKATPKKRTWLGRLSHEGCWVSRPVAGKPLAFYMGDDSRNEYIYKFVTDAVWDPADATRGMAAGDKYLDSGKLYAAKFNADGTGQWLELAHGKNGLTSDNATFPFTSQAAVIVATRLAADTVGATKMDRPEWGGVNPVTGEVYMTLTNNTVAMRGAAGLDAANPRSYEDVDGKKGKGNVNGHIIRWKEDGDLAAASGFQWDVYVFGAEHDADKKTINLSGLDASNDMSAPDGIWFDPRGLLWIQTDDGAYTDVSNCMMLAAIPGKVGDGEAVTVNGVTTYKGKNPGTALRRFLVGSKDCEITGVDMTPDGKTMFVNVQHPGENGGRSVASMTSHWPASESFLGGSTTARPRSATIVITRNDGGVIGL